MPRKKYWRKGAALRRRMHEKASVPELRSDRYLTKLPFPKRREGRYLATPPWLEHQFFDAPSTNRIDFWVKTANDVDIALATAPSDNSDKEYYRIGIGAIFNTEVHAYSMWSYDNRVVKKINGLLSQSEYMGFWITWNNGHIKLGKAGRKSQILEYQDNAKIPLTVNYIGYSTAFGSPGEFLLYSH